MSRKRGKGPGTAKGTPRPKERPQRRAETPIWPGVAAAALVGLVYLMIASGGTFRFRPSAYPHHVLVADAWLHGQLHIRDEVLQQRNELYYQRYRASLERRYRAQGRQLTDAEWQQIRSRLKPPSMHDWSYFEGRYYGYWGPMVSTLLLPYVAVAGLRASDMLFSCLVGACSVFLTFLLLREGNRRRLVPATTSLCVALALFLGLGTVHFYLAVAGQVWFLSQIVATFFSTLAIWCILRVGTSWLWATAAGAAFGASFLSRNSLLTIGPFFPCAIYAVCLQDGQDVWQRTIRRTFAFLVPLALAGAVMLAFNHARFGNIFEDGVRIQLETGANPRFKQDYDEYGAFSLHYLPRNIYYYFLNPSLRRLRRTGTITFDPSGNSMFLVSPALLYVFRSFRRRHWFTIGLWVGAGTCLAVLLLFFGTGWYNFGNRYLLDLMPLAILLVALGMGGRLTKVSVALVGLSMLANAWGTYRFTSEQF